MNRIARAARDERVRCTAALWRESGQVRRALGDPAVTPDALRYILAASVETLHSEAATGYGLLVERSAQGAPEARDLRAALAAAEEAIEVANGARRLLAGGDG